MLVSRSNCKGRLVRWKHAQAVAAPENANGAVQREVGKIMTAQNVRCASEQEDATSLPLPDIDVAEREKWKKLVDRATNCLMQMLL